MCHNADKDTLAKKIKNEMLLRCIYEQAESWEEGFIKAMELMELHNNVSRETNDTKEEVLEEKENI